LLSIRAGDLKSTAEPAAAVSREGAFALQNLLLLGVVAVVLWGTVLPLVSGMVGQEQVVDAGYYQRAAGPLILVVLALMAAGPLLPWRRAGRTWVRALRWPAGVAVLTAVALAAAGVRSVAALLALPLAVAVAATCGLVFARVLHKRSWAALAKNRRRYGAYLAHLGLAALVIGIAASNFWQRELDVTLRPGSSATVSGYTLTYTGIEQRTLPDHSEVVALMSFGGQTLEPARASYAGLGGQSLTHVAISTTPLADVYVVLAGTNPDGSASFRILVNPLVSWIWAGGIVIILGVILGNVGAPRREPVRALVPARQT
jgi:cytochrome c-type biogenesis protein CcmF